VPDVLAALLIALAVLAVVGHVFPNYDSFYALVWGRDLTHGRAPDYSAPFAPAAHPLVNAVAAGANLLGTSAAVDLMRATGPLALGALCVGLYRLGEALYAWPVGLLAAAITATREPILVAAARGYVDVPTTALIVWAAVLEARRPRRGVAVLVLLTAAGLLRPEAWLLAGAYLLWMVPACDWNDRLRLAALAAAGPLLWLLSDFAVTGDPLFRFHGLRATFSETFLGNPAPTTRTGVAAVPDALAHDLGNALRPVPLALAVAGSVVGLVWLRRRTLLPAAVAALNTAAFLVLAVTGIPLEQRYLFPTVAMLTLFAALFAVGWPSLASSTPRRAWAVGGLCGIAALLAFVPSDARRIDGVHSTLAARDRVEADLMSLIRQPSSARLIERSQVVLVQSPGLLPFLAFWTEKPPGAFSIDLANPSAASAFVAAQSGAAAQYLTGVPALPPSSETPPPGFERASASDSWALYRRD
jgi:hypothetical protein